MDAASRAILILAWKFQASDQGKFSLEEFNNGMSDLRASSLSELKERLLDIDSKIDNDTSEFKDLYIYTFDFAKQKSYKSLETEVAIEYEF